MLIIKETIIAVSKLSVSTDVSGVKPFLSVKKVITVEIRKLLRIRCTAINALEKT